MRYGVVMTQSLARYEKTTVATADLKPGDIISCPVGAGSLLGAIARVTRNGDDTIISYWLESYGRRRLVSMRPRKTSGRSTVYVAREVAA